MKIVRLLIIVALTLGLAGCELEKQARDAAAALGGSLTSAQAKYQVSCAGNPSQPICQTINRAISAQNALITATQAYCGWNASLPPPDANAKCVPLKGAEAGFRAAIGNANQITKEIRGAL